MNFSDYIVTGLGLPDYSLRFYRDKLLAIMEHKKREAQMNELL